MGNCISSTGFERRPIRASNYHCPKCMLYNELPNAAGRFFIINERECQCNGCGTVYNKNIAYTPVAKETGQPVENHHTVPHAVEDSSFISAEPSPAEYLEVPLFAFPSSDSAGSEERVAEATLLP